MAKNLVPNNPIIPSGDKAKKVSGKKAQGFTINSNTGKFFSARLTNGAAGDNHVYLTRLKTNGEVDKVLADQAIGHANDCAYYNGRIYIAPEQGDKIIYSYETDFTGKKEHGYVNVQNAPFSGSFTCIAYIPGSNGWFVLGCKDHYVCAYLHDGKFNGYSSFDIPAWHKRDSDSFDRQGICVTNDALYKVYSHKKSGVITKNDIVSYALGGSTPSYSTAAKGAEYTFDNADKNLNFFEAEGISHYDGNDYVSVTVHRTDKDSNHFNNRIYKVTL